MTSVLRGIVVPRIVSPLEKLLCSDPHQRRLLVTRDEWNAYKKQLSARDAAKQPLPVTLLHKINSHGPMGRVTRLWDENGVGYVDFVLDGDSGDFAKMLVDSKIFNFEVSLFSDTNTGALVELSICSRGARSGSKIVDIQPGSYSLDVSDTAQGEPIKREGVVAASVATSAFTYAMDAQQQQPPAQGAKAPAPGDAAAAPAAPVPPAVAPGAVPASADAEQLTPEDVEELRRELAKIPDGDRRKKLLGGLVAEYDRANQERLDARKKQDERNATALALLVQTVRELMDGRDDVVNVDQLTRIMDGGRNQADVLGELQPALVAASAKAAEYRKAAAAGSGATHSGQRSDVSDVLHSRLSGPPQLPPGGPVVYQPPPPPSAARSTGMGELFRQKFDGLVAASAHMNQPPAARAHPQAQATAARVQEVGLLGLFANLGSSDLDEMERKDEAAARKLLRGEFSSDDGNDMGSKRRRT